MWVCNREGVATVDDQGLVSEVSRIYVTEGQEFV